MTKKYIKKEILKSYIKKNILKWLFYDHVANNDHFNADEDDLKIRFHLHWDLNEVSTLLVKFTDRKRFCEYIIESINYEIISN